MQTNRQRATTSSAVLLVGVVAALGARALTHVAGAMTPAAVPEPSTRALLATGIVGLAGALVRRRHRAV